MAQPVQKTENLMPAGCSKPVRQILLVDDELVVLTIASRILRSAGYRVLEASSARQALQTLEQCRSAVDLVLTDVVMPEIDGLTLGRSIAAGYPGLPVLYMSAYPIKDLFPRGSSGSELPVLTKPFSPATLVAAVESLLLSAPGKLPA